MGNGQQLASRCRLIFKMRNETRHSVARARDDRVLRAHSAQRSRHPRAALLDRRRHSALRPTKTAAMAPCRGKACMRRARSTISPSPCIQRVHACAIGGRKLADAVSQYDVGNNAPGPPQINEAGLHGEQRWLRVGGFVDQSIRIVAEEYVSERPPQAVAHDLGAAIDLLSEYRLMSIELRTHVGVLRRLPGEQKSQPALSGRSSARCRCRIPRRALPAIALSSPTTAANRIGKCVRPLVLVKQMSGKRRSGQSSKPSEVTLDRCTQVPRRSCADSVNKARSGSPAISAAARRLLRARRKRWYRQDRAN